MYILIGLAVAALLIGVVFVGYGRARHRGDESGLSQPVQDASLRTNPTNTNPDMPSDIRHETEQADYGA